MKQSDFDKEVAESKLRVRNWMDWPYETIADDHRKLILDHLAGDNMIMAEVINSQGFTGGFRLDVRFSVSSPYFMKELYTHMPTIEGNK